MEWMINGGWGFEIASGGSAAAAPAAKTVYVAKTGNDSTGTGLVGAPYLTIGTVQIGGDASFTVDNL